MRPPRDQAGIAGADLEQQQGRNRDLGDDLNDILHAPITSSRSSRYERDVHTTVGDGDVGDGDVGDGGVGDGVGYVSHGTASTGNVKYGNNKATTKRDYGPLAEFIYTDNAYLFFRRFGKLNLERLLYLQDQIIKLEAELEQVKEAAMSGLLCAVGEDEVVTNAWVEMKSGAEENYARYQGGFDGDNGREGRGGNGDNGGKIDHEARKDELMEKIAGLLERYNTALDQQSRLSTFEPPSKRLLLELHDWQHDHAYPPTKSPSTSTNPELNPTHDIIDLSPLLQRKSSFYRLIESLTYRLFSTKTTTPQGTIYIYNDTTVRRLCRFLITLITSIALLAPVVALFFLEREQGKGWIGLIVILASTAVFAGVLAGMTDARDTEVTMAAAAYGAVMVVFISK